MEERKSDVLDVDKVNEAVEGVIGLFAGMELTVAESVKAAHAVDMALKATYPDVYGFLAGD